MKILRTPNHCHCGSRQQCSSTNHSFMVANPKHSTPTLLTCSSLSPRFAYVCNRLCSGHSKGRPLCPPGRPQQKYCSNGSMEQQQQRETPLPETVLNPGGSIPQNVFSPQIRACANPQIDLPFAAPQVVVSALCSPNDNTRCLSCCCNGEPRNYIKPSSFSPVPSSEAARIVATCSRQNGTQNASAESK
eukprot:2395236-Amphidinium_carterae.1